MAAFDSCTLALGASLRAVLETMTRSGKQIALVVDADGRLAGVVTDGDVRRAMLRGASLDAKVDEVVNRAPLTGPAGLSASEAPQLMRTRSVRHLPLLDPERRVVDLLRLEDLLAPPADRVHAQAPHLRGRQAARRDHDRAAAPVRCDRHHHRASPQVGDDPG